MSDVPPAESASRGPEWGVEARLRAVLAALPELVLELDAQGALLACHAGCGAMAAAPTMGAPLEQWLPAGPARLVRRMMAGEPIADPALALDLGHGERLWRVSLSAIAGAGHLLVLRDIAYLPQQREEIAMLSQVARRMNDLVVVTDAARRIEWVNAAFERVTGWTLADIRGRSPGSVLQSEATDADTVALMRRALDAGEPVQTELLNRRRDGRPYWVRLNIQPLRDAAGRLAGYMSVQSEITGEREQRLAREAAARQAADARAMLEAAVESLQDGFVLFDADDRLVICNRRYREMYALSAEAIRPGVTFEEGLRYGLARGQYAEAVGREEAWLAERMARHRAAEAEIEQQLADGRWVRVFEKATPDGGRVGLRVDITALKLAERRALADRSAAMEASQDGIAITDAAGRFAYMNQAHLAMFALREDAQVLGRHWSMLYAPEGAEWIQAHAMPVLRARGRWSGEIMGRAPDGTPVDQDLALTLQANGNLLWITRDMRERRREAAERETLRTELQLAQRREVVGQMAAGLAHDFTNLLAAIGGSAELIAEDPTVGGTAARSVQRIIEASGNAAALVRRLLTIGTHEAVRGALDLRKPLREAAELLRASLCAPARLVLHLPEDAVEAAADPTDLLQLVLNLGINARDALAGEPGEVRIRLEAARIADPATPVVAGRLDAGRRYACLSVADNGIGMPPELVAQIFRPYFSTKADNGTGLGMSVVGSIVTGNGGAIGLDTAPGKGSCFRIYWPVEELAPTPLPADLTGRLDGRAVLVVDDVPGVLFVTAGMLEAVGAEVAPSTEFQDVLDALREDPEAWSLLVTDFDMPGMNGIELARAARALSPGLPVVLLTAVPATAEPFKTDFDAVLAKPVSREALISAAESAMLHVESRRAANARTDRR
ncbi:MAG: PAS domain-containing protein [Alphaproteobacteria bacterium]|nr:PAS domain-containing protein [Alphaproteobacteria bacterium]